MNNDYKLYYVLDGTRQALVRAKHPTGAMHASGFSNPDEVLEVDIQAFELVKPKRVEDSGMVGDLLLEFDSNERYPADDLEDD